MLRPQQSGLSKARSAASCTLILASDSGSRAKRMASVAMPTTRTVREAREFRQNLRGGARHPGTSMTVVGFGKTQPVGSNNTAARRQQNRRVELVVSGEVIGTKIGGDSNAISTQPQP